MAVQFRNRQKIITGEELDQLLDICPSQDTFRAGLKLQAPDVNELYQTARELSDHFIVPDEDLSSKQKIEVLQQALFLLQLGLEVAEQENEVLVEENNQVQKERQELTREKENLEDEVEELRTQLEANEDAARIAELEEEIDTLVQEQLEYKRQLTLQDDKLLTLEEQHDRDSQEIRLLQDRLEDTDKELRDERAEVAKLREDVASLEKDLREYEGRLELASLQDNRRQMQESLRQQDTKMDRLSKENRALEAKNSEMATQLDDLRAENLQVSEKIVLLDDECRDLRLRTSELEAVAEKLREEKAQLLSMQDELQSAVQERTELLEELGTRFERQYRSWEEEKSAMQAQIELLRKEAMSLSSPRRAPLTAGADGRMVQRPGTAGALDAAEAELEELHHQLQEVKENEVLLLEAYEQLERDVGAEIDKALAKQDGELQRLQRRVEFLDAQLATEKEAEKQLREAQQDLEQQLEEESQRNQLYEQGVYGLPQATQEIKATRAELNAERRRIGELTTNLNKLSSQVEDLADENIMLRKKAGLPEGQALDVTQMRQQRQVTIAQLRSVNAMLENQVSDLEEERRKLRMELKFRAKYHGQAALELGLAPEQLLLVEQYVEELKYGKSNDGGLVAKLQKRIEMLEMRLAEVLAYADIPPAMRARLAEADVLASRTYNDGMLLGSSLRALPTKQLQRAHQAVSVALSHARTLTRKQHDAKSGDSSAQKAAAEQVAQQLKEADAVLQGMLAAQGATGDLDMTASGSFSAGYDSDPGNAWKGSTGGSRPGSRLAVAGADVGGEAGMAPSQVTEALQHLAAQLAQLHVELARKDAQLQLVLSNNVNLGDGLHGLAAGEGGDDGRQGPPGDAAQLQREVVFLKQQLVDARELLGGRDREVARLHSSNLRFHSKMQGLTDQVKLFYREYATSKRQWEAERKNHREAMLKVQQDLDGFKLSHAQLQDALATMQAGSRDEMQHKYVEAVRRAAVVQVKHAKVARQLELSAASEIELRQRVEELEDEVADVGGTLNARISWLRAALLQAQRRAEQMFLELQATVPSSAYHELAAKAHQLLSSNKQLVEERADAVLASEEALQLRDAVASLRTRCCDLAAAAAELRTLNKGMEAALAQQGVDAAGFVATSLVAASAERDTALMRMELAAADVKSLQRELADARSRLGDMESRLASSTGELTGARLEASQLAARYQGGKSAAETREILARLHGAETLRDDAQQREGELQSRAEQAELQARDKAQRAIRYLAEITHLRKALKDAAGATDSSASMAKLHSELSHVRNKEALIRGALNRSELERVELLADTRRLLQQLGLAFTQLGSYQEYVITSERQTRAAQGQLQQVWAEQVDSWKARWWSRKLQLLMQRNNVLAGSEAAAAKRMEKLEQAVAEWQAAAEDATEAASLNSQLQIPNREAQLRDANQRLRLEHNKSQREATTQRERARYLETIHAQAQQELERLEAEAMAYESQLHQQQRQAQQMQDELQRRLNEFHARVQAHHLQMATAPGKGAANGVAGSGMLRKLQVAQDGYGSPAPALQPDEVYDWAGLTASVKDTMFASYDVARKVKEKADTMAQQDRDYMLQQVENLTDAREKQRNMELLVSQVTGELERTRNAQRKLQELYDDAVDRLKQQAESHLAAMRSKPKDDLGAAALENMERMAEDAQRQLTERLHSREAEIERLRSQLEGSRGEAIRREQELTQQLQRTRQALLEKERDLVTDLRNASSQLAVRPEYQGGEEEMPYDELKALLDQRTAELEKAVNLLDQRENAIQVLQANLDAQARHFEQQVEDLQAELAKPPKEDTVLKLKVSKLASELRGKDERLRGLRETIKALEERLKEKLRDEADASMKNSSWAEQEALDKALQDLQEDKRSLLAELQTSRVSLTAAQEATQAVEGQLAAAKTALSRETAANAQLRRQLTQERQTTQALKAAQGQVADVTTGLSAGARLQMDALQKRIAVLEKQNERLKQLLKAEEGASARGRPAQAEVSEHAAAPQARQVSPPCQTVRPDSASQVRHVSPPRQPETAGTTAEARAAPAVRTAAPETRAAGSAASSARSAQRPGKDAAALKELQAQLTKKNAVLLELQRKVDMQGAAVQDLQKQLQAAKAAARPHPDTSRLQTYVQSVLRLEAENERLRAETANLAAQQGSVPPAEGPARDEELFKLRLQRDQAVAATRRLESHLNDLFGSAGMPSSTEPKSGKASTSKSAGGMTAREVELMSVVDNLKAALERTSASTVPATQYMGELNRRKAVQQEAAQARQEAEEARGQLKLMEQRCAALQVANSDMRQQLAAAQRQAAAAAGVSAPGGRFHELEGALAAREDEVAELRRALQEARTAAGGDQVSALQRRVSELQEENNDLKTELNAFDPSFFEEIEDLKHDHYQLTQRCADYEQRLRDLTAQLQQYQQSRAGGVR